MAENNDREEVFSKSVRAGKRTYFFDVKMTRTNDYYLTITESKRRTGDDGSPIYEKHKIFLYREDFEKFLDGFNESTQRVNELIVNSPEGKPPAPSPSMAASTPNTAPPPDSAAPPATKKASGSNFTDVNFDDLG